MIFPLDIIRLRAAYKFKRIKLLRLLGGQAFKIKCAVTISGRGDTS